LILTDKKLWKYGLYFDSVVQQRASEVALNCRVGQLKKVAYELSENIVQDGNPVSYNSTRPDLFRITNLTHNSFIL